MDYDTTIAAMQNASGDVKTMLKNYNSSSISELVWPFHEPALFKPWFWEVVPSSVEIFLFGNHTFPFYVAAVYVALIFGLQHYMKDKEAFKLRKSLFVWNFLLGIFSMVGFYRVTQEFVTIMQQGDGIFNSLCVRYKKYID